MYMRHAFRQMTHGQGEIVLQVQFVTRLRAAAKDGGYGKDTENQIQDEYQCTGKCHSDYLYFIFEAGEGLMLAHTLDLAGKCEEVEKQMANLYVESVVRTHVSSG